MEHPKTNPELPVTPHIPEIKPMPPQQLPPVPHNPEIAPNKKDPSPSKSPSEIPPKNP